MKILSIISLSLHVLMLCLTFIKNAEGFQIKIQFFQLHQEFREIENDELPEPLPAPSPPPSQYYPSAHTNGPTESYKTFSVSRPTLNPEQEELLARTTPLSNSEKETHRDNLIAEDISGLPSNKGNNNTNEHDKPENNQNLALQDDIAVDYANNGYNGTENITKSYDNGYNNENEELENSSSRNWNSSLWNNDNNISTPVFPSDHDDNTTEREAQFQNMTLDSEGRNKTENFSLRIFRKMFDPRRVDLVYFFGGVAAIMSIVGALALTRKLYKAQS